MDQCGSGGYDVTNLGRDPSETFTFTAFSVSNYMMSLVVEIVVCFPGPSSRWLNFSLVVEIVVRFPGPSSRK